MSSSTFKKLTCKVDKLSDAVVQADDYSLTHRNTFCITNVMISSNPGAALFHAKLMGKGLILEMAIKKERIVIRYDT